jgi:hypothetical protein
MDASFLSSNAYQAVACQWFLIGLTTGIAAGMVLSALMRWMTDAHH